MSQGLIFADIGDIAPRHVVGEEIRILADHAQTGSYEIYLHDAPEGAGPPLHSHDWDEAFFVISGELEFVFDGEKRIVKAGGFVHVPAGTHHGFTYACNARIIGVTSKGGAAGLFTAVDQHLNVRGPDMTALASVLSKNGLNLAN